MKINKDRIIEEFGLRPMGQKNWYIGMECPFCNHKDKFGIVLNDVGVSSFNCFRGSCSEKGTLFKLLKKIGRLDLLQREDIDPEAKLEDKINISEEIELDYSVPKKNKPLGFKYVKQDDYLDSRGFLPIQYELFNVGVATIEPSLKNYIVFLLKNEDEIVGYLARSKRSKEWHHLNDERSKQGLCKKVLRYQNSKNTDFEKILGGSNEIIKGKTKTVILVEGLMDKANTDIQLDLYDQDGIKCCFTFGNKVSPYQIKRLQDKDVENVILLYDHNTIKQTQQYGVELNRYFNCKVGEILWTDCDPGNMIFEQFMTVLDNLKDPIKYNLDRVQKKLLK